MDQNPEAYQTLGRKTLYIFISETVAPATIFFVATIVLFIVGLQAPGIKTPVGDLASLARTGALWAFVLFLLIGIVTFFVAWLTYTNYRFALREDSLKITRGIFNKEEISIPYRQIQNVTIDRDLTFQMFGVSKVIISTAGEGDTAEGKEGSEGILPAIDKAFAETLQNELLKRANVQEVVSMNK